MIVNCIDRTDGLITLNDLKNYKAVIREPISFEYRDYKIHSMPPASSGGVALALILNQLENIDFANIPYHSSDHIHYVSEAERRAYADRAYFLGDMDYVPVPIDELINTEYADMYIGKWWEYIIKYILPLEFIAVFGYFIYEKLKDEEFPIENLEEIGIEEAWFIMSKQIEK